jgi:hypothetical protein
MTPPQEPHVVLPLKLAQALFDYLKQRPFVEVASLVDGLLKAPRAEIQPTPPPKEGEKP